MSQVGASRLLGRLRGAGSLRRQPGRTDRQARRIVLTDEGLALAARVRDVRIVALRTMLDALDTDDEDRLEAILDRMLLGSGFDRLAFVQQAAGLVVLAPVPAMTLAFTGGFGTLTLTTFALAVLGGLLQNTAAVWLHLEALKWMPAASFALYLGLVPVFALGAARVVLGEPITAPQLVGGALVVAAALIAAKREIALRDVKEMESHT